MLLVLLSVISFFSFTFRLSLWSLFSVHTRLCTFTSGKVHTLCSQIQIRAWKYVQHNTGVPCLFLNTIRNSTVVSLAVWCVRLCSLIVTRRYNEQTCPRVLAQYTHTYICLLTFPSFYESLRFLLLFVPCSVLHYEVTICVCVISLIYLELWYKYVLFSLQFMCICLYVCMCVDVCECVRKEVFR